MKVLLLLFLLLFSQCSKEKSAIIIDENGVVVTQPYIWRVQVSEKGYNGGYVFDAIYDNEGVLLGAQDKEGFDYLMKLALKDGKTIWTSEYIKKTDLFSLYNTYRNKNQIVIKDGYDIGLIDLDNGNYSWKTRISSDSWSAEWLSGIDSIYFIIKVEPYQENLYPVECAYVGLTHNESNELFLIPDLGDLPDPDFNQIGISIGGFRYLKPYRDFSSGDIILVCYYGKNYHLPNSDEMESQSYLGLYNFSKKTWIYDKAELGEYSWLIGFTPTIKDNRIYHTLDALEGDIVECRNLNTGDIIWRKEVPYQFSDNGFTIADGKMIVIDDLTRSLIALNIDNGHEVWRTKAAATCSMIYELNGVIYFIRGSDGILYAVEVSSGKILWSMESPDHSKDTYDYFKSEVKVIPGKAGEKGKIIVSSFTHAYCYEAAK